MRIRRDNASEQLVLQLQEVPKRSQGNSGQVNAAEGLAATEATCCHPTLLANALLKPRDRPRQARSRQEPEKARPSNSTAMHAWADSTTKIIIATCRTRIYERSTKPYHSNQIGVCMNNSSRTFGQFLTEWPQPAVGFFYQMGTGEELKCIDGLKTFTINDNENKPTNVCYAALIKTENFIIPYQIFVDSYVLAKVEPGSTKPGESYYDLNADLTKALQTEGKIPNPTPTYQIGLDSYLPTVGLIALVVIWLFWQIASIKQQADTARETTRKSSQTTAQDHIEDEAFRSMQSRGDHDNQDNSCDSSDSSSSNDSCSSD